MLDTAITEVKEIQIGKRGIFHRLSLFVDDMILYIENLKDATGKLLGLINEFDLKKSCCWSVFKSCLTLCDPMNYNTLGFPVLDHLPEFAQTHVH